MASRGTSGSRATKPSGTASGCGPTTRNSGIAVRALDGPPFADSALPPLAGPLPTVGRLAAHSKLG